MRLPFNERIILFVIMSIEYQTNLYKIDFLKRYSCEISKINSFV